MRRYPTTSRELERAFAHEREMLARAIRRDERSARTRKAGKTKEQLLARRTKA